MNKIERLIDDPAIDLEYKIRLFGAFPIYAGIYAKNIRDHDFEQRIAALEQKRGLHVVGRSS
jgi:hypothetical protein